MRSMTSTSSSEYRSLMSIWASVRFLTSSVHQVPARNSLEPPWESSMTPSWSQMAQSEMSDLLIKISTKFMVKSEPTLTKWSALAVRDWKLAPTIFSQAVESMIRIGLLAAWTKIRENVCYCLRSIVFVIGIMILGSQQPNVVWILMRDQAASRPVKRNHLQLWPICKALILTKRSTIVKG